MKKKFSIIFILICKVFAVINNFEDSYSVKNNINSPFESIQLPNINVEELLIEDKQTFGTGIPMRYAYKFEVDLGINNVGTWEELEDGSKIWRLGIYSFEAYGMKLYFNAFSLPKGSEIYVYSEYENMSIGPYTHEQNNEDQTFGIPLVRSDRIVVEYYQPSNVTTNPKLNINKIFHAYRDIHGYYDEGGNRDCGDNVACSSANSWEDQVNSVIYLEMGQYICSAALINNTNQDKTPYVLTAYHCVEGEGNLGQHNYFTFYFNHQSASCNGSSGYYGNSETGSYIRSWGNMSSSDFALLEMDDDPPSWWNPYFAGWSRYSSQTLGAGIHHPGGAAKKINFDNDQASNCGWYGSNTHYCLNWDEGGTAGGSSGAPLFNSSKLIVGQLSGGTGSECSGNGTDYYGKLTTSWSSNNSSSYNLKYWLDPSNTNQYTLQGTYDGANIIYGCTDNSACNYNNEATNNDGSCEYAQGSCDCNGDPTENYCDCSYNVIDECGICSGDGSSCSGSVILNFGAINGNEGTAEILMTNDIDVGGFQFVINDNPNVIDLMYVNSGSSESNGFQVSNNYEGQILGFSLTGENIPEGNGILLMAYFESSTDVNTELCLNDAIFSDIYGNGIPVTIDDCINMNYTNSLVGDLNQDNIVNVLDIVILVDIVLNLGYSNAADLNDDSIVNVLDVVILVNIILD